MFLLIFLPNLVVNLTGFTVITCAELGSPGVETLYKAGELSSSELAIIFICETSDIQRTNWLLGI